MEPTRHPRESSALLEGVEVLAVGLLSIAVIVGPWTLLEPDGVERLVRDPSADLRRAVLVIAALVLGSTAVAYSLARVRLARLPNRYTPTVWTKTFDEYRDGHVREALVELVDGRLYQGVLLAFTLDPTVEQQISLRAPIARVDGPRRQPLLQERMAFFSAQIASISMQYVEDGALPPDPVADRVSGRVTGSMLAGIRAARAEWASHSGTTASSVEAATVPVVGPDSAERDATTSEA